MLGHSYTKSNCCTTINTNRLILGLDTHTNFPPSIYFPVSQNNCDLAKDTQVKKHLIPHTAWCVAMMMSFYAQGIPQWWVAAPATCYPPAMLSGNGRSFYLRLGCKPSHTHRHKSVMFSRNTPLILIEWALPFAVVNIKIWDIMVNPNLCLEKSAICGCTSYAPIIIGCAWWSDNTWTHVHALHSLNRVCKLSSHPYGEI